MNKQKASLAQTFTAFIIAFFGSKFAFHLMGFEYNLFKDPFDLGKFLIDIGVFFGLFLLGIIVFNLLFKKTKH